MKVRFADDALADLDSIGDFIARDNPHRAITFVDEIREACERLAQFPLRYQTWEFGPDPNIRKMPHGRYVVFYLVNGEEVMILHSIHGARLA